MQKVYYPCLDYIRTIACFLVVLLHVCAVKFYSFSPAWHIHVAYDALARMCVPLFFMLSGFLLLDYPIDSLGRFYKARFQRILIPFLLLAVIYYFTPLYANYSLAAYFCHILTHHLDYHLWYIYALTGIYLALPFFAAILQNRLANSFAAVYLAIWLAFGVAAPFLRRYWQLGGDFPVIFNLGFFNGFMGYLLCGWALKRLHEKLNVFWLGLAAAALIGASLGIYWGTVNYSRLQGAPNELFFENLTPLVFIQTVAFFTLCMGLNKSGKFVRNLADKTFWVYLLHALVLRAWLKIAPLPANDLAWLAIPLYACVIFCLSFCAALPMRALEKRIFIFLDRCRLKTIHRRSE